MSISALIDAAVRCAKCGKGLRVCNCWTKCWCGHTNETGQPCERVDEHPRRRLLQTYRASFGCMCEARQQPAKVCAEKRSPPLKSPCRCLCHRKDVRAVLAVETEANARPRCTNTDNETNEQCIHEPGHDAICMAATEHVLEMMRK